VEVEDLVAWAPVTVKARVPAMAAVPVLEAALAWAMGQAPGRSAEAPDDPAQWST